METILSVIIPCFNHGIYIEKAIESVLAFKNHSLIEIIIVNDGSTDKLTNDVLNGIDHPIVTVLNQQNSGLAKARNNGIKMAKGEYILPLDSDNYIDPEYIEKSIVVLKKYENVGVVYSDMYVFKDGTSEFSKPESYNVDLKYLIFGKTIDACAVFRKRVWEKLGGYDENMPVMGYEDWDFWIRALEKGIKFHHFDEALFYYRDVPVSMLKNVGKNKEVILEYIVRKHAHLYSRYILEVGKELFNAKKMPFQFLLKNYFRKN